MATCFFVFDKKSGDQPIFYAVTYFTSPPSRKDMHDFFEKTHKLKHGTFYVYKTSKKEEIDLCMSLKKCKPVIKSVCFFWKTVIGIKEDK